MPTTNENLQIAFAGESQANRKYLAFARKAEAEGRPQIARLLRAVAEAETLHAMAHLANMGGIGSTQENLRAALAGETYEFTEMYPPMVEQAKSENHKAHRMLGLASAAEKIHAGLFQRGLTALESGADLPAAEVYFCPICGDVELGKPPEKCPLCGAPASKFQLVS
ncbi:MAG TPA: rubrerythrin family protein [Anaeromyxobacteraceae bacterium]|nr:rubrerythrin family protein [Anaeromyxobacteraceae bacterium]